MTNNTLPQKIASIEERFDREDFEGGKTMDGDTINVNYQRIKSFYRTAILELLEDKNKSIIAYIEDCESKGFDDRTIVENLKNKFILADLIKES